jgi:Ser-tRNA(Ala) deacylase AlaX
MDMQSRKQYLKVLQRDYLKASRKQKLQLLDEAIARTELDRKYLIRKLSAKTSWQPKQRKARVPTYDGEVKAALVKIWDIFDQPCGQRLAPLLPEQVPLLRATAINLSI